MENSDKYPIFKKYDEEEKAVEEVTTLKRFNLYKKAYENSNDLIDKDSIPELSIKEMTEICVLLDEVFGVASDSFKDDKLSKLAYKAVQEIRDACYKYVDVKFDD